MFANYQLTKLTHSSNILYLVKFLIKVIIEAYQIRKLFKTNNIIHLNRINITGDYRNSNVCWQFLNSVLFLSAKLQTSKCLYQLFLNYKNNWFYFFNLIVR